MKYNQLNLLELYRKEAESCHYSLNCQDGHVKSFLVNTGSHRHIPVSQTLDMV